MSQRTEQEKEKLKKDKLSGFFLDMAKLSFAAMVLGGVMPLLNGESSASNIMFFILGIMMTFIFALIGYTILK